MATTLDVIDDYIRKNTKDSISSHTDIIRDNIHDVIQRNEQNNYLSSSTLNTMSHLSGDVDRWIHGSGTTSPTENTSVQGSRVAVEQRSTLVNSASLGYNGGSIWYMMAMILPIFNVQNCVQWRNCPSNLLSAAELFLRQLAGLCGLARNQVRRFAQEQMTQDIFATAMDFVLLLYAMGFLVISMYQASIIG